MNHGIFAQPDQPVASVNSMNQHEIMKSPKGTNKVGDAKRKTEHDYGIQNTNVDTKLKSISCHNTEQFPRKSFMFNATSILQIPEDYIARNEKY